MCESVVHDEHHDPQELGERIERVVQEYISATRVAAQTAMDRAFATSVEPTAKRQRQQSARRVNHRRPSAELTLLGERLYAAMCKAPAETMMVLAPTVDRSARELHRPMALLKRS
jgi:cytochrome c5